MTRRSKQFEPVKSRVRELSGATLTSGIQSCALALLLFISIAQECEAQDSATAGRPVQLTSGDIRAIIQGAGYPVFDKGSFWYQPIPREVPLHPMSEQYAREFARQVKAYFGHIGINFGDWSSPLYTAKPDTPKENVTLWDCWHNGYKNEKLEQDFTAVPIPSSAEPAGGTDSEMSVYDPVTDTLWEFWKARKIGSGWQACWGGRMANVADNPGIWLHPYGVAATGLPFAPGQILVDELKRGEIHHVLGIAVVDAEEANFSWPANRTDGWNPKKARDRIPEGLRLRLDPTVDLESLHLHPIAKIVAKAAQIYGLVVWDKGGSVALRAENPKRYTTVGLQDPYPPLFDGTPGYKLMDRFPWDKMQFLPMDYGRPK